MSFIEYMFLLDNIDIWNREELLAIHTDMKTWLELQPSERSIESAQFLALQIQLARRVFH